MFISKLGIDCKQVGPIIYINNVVFQAFPSHTISSSRGYTNVKFIFIDEAAFFPPGQQDEVRAVCEAYRPKSNPYIVMVSTPYKPGDLFEQIDRDQNSVFKKGHSQVNQSQLQKSITMRFEISSTRQTDIVAKANTGRLLCNCPSSEPGKINLDVYAHEPNCRIRKRLQTKRYTVDTSVTPEKFVDGYALGVAV